MNRKLTTTGAAGLLVLALAGAQGSCGGSGSAKPGNTQVVPGDTNESVTCTEDPYDYNAKAIEADGSGVSVARGQVRGALWVSCTGGQPDTWSVIVILIRDGQELKPGARYTAVPNEVGYQAYTFTECVPGTYHLYYRYVWTLQGGVQQNTKTVTADRVVTQHDCDES